MLAVLASGALIPPPIAHATYSGKNGRNGKIAFVAPGKGGNLDVYTIHKDGTHKRQLTRTNKNEYAPTFSPKGRAIAFERSSGIFGMSAGGRNITFVGPGESPSFSPDGQKLAFIGPDDGEVYRMLSSNGGNVQKLTNQPHSGASDSEPAWGSSGKIAYVQCCPDAGPGGNGGDSLWEVNPNGTGQGLFGGKTIEGWAPDWSPDGTHLAYTGFGAGADISVYIRQADGTGKHIVIGDDPGFGFSEAVWSPNGKLFVLKVQPDGRPGYLATVRKNGTGFRKIPHTKGASSPTWQPR
jgi:Tol biopolymer transport system component